MNYKKELTKLGFSDNVKRSRILDFIAKECKHMDKCDVLPLVSDIASNPSSYIKYDKQSYRNLASLFLDESKISRFELADEPKEYFVFGKEFIENLAIKQMDTAMRLPITVGGALMPDAHAGYGLPIGGVLATDNVVIPYAVGLDIGCGMGLSLFHENSEWISKNTDRIVRHLKANTAFGMDVVLKSKHFDALFDRREFVEIPILKKLRDKAIRQLGTSGGGNHFVDVCEVLLHDGNPYNVPEGSYSAILSHSGSRGMGASIAEYFTKIAKNACMLPKEAGAFAWLDMNSENGILYWTCMNIAAEYSAISHSIIHENVMRCFRSECITYSFNHHNLAWKEVHDGKDVIVHRKGATPAHKGDVCVIPSSMTGYGVIGSGNGNPESFCSASHGTGRLFSRQDARNMISHHELRKHLEDCGVTLVGGTTEEAPQAYKSMDLLMPVLSCFVDVWGIIKPKIVVMSDERE